MPDDYNFHILVTGDKKMDGRRFFRSQLYVLPTVFPWSRFGEIRHTIAMLYHGVRIARSKRIDLIVCYDPLTLGFIGCVSKILSGAKLLVEVNGHFRNAKDASLGGGKPSWFKKKMVNFVTTVSLLFADCVKILNEEQLKEWEGVLKRKKVVMFHDFVPVMQFKKTTHVDDSFIICLGFPFYRKGIDILLEAFSYVRKEFPDIQLKIFGHCREPELSFWKKQASSIQNVHFCKPIPYEKMSEFLGRSTLLAVPSRSEGMGRVFIEAMACGKPCIGTRVGGVPNVIIDGETGFLVSPENSAELASKLRQLLGDKNMRKKMGEMGQRRAESILSEKAYVNHFKKTVELIFNKERKCKGLLFNGFVEELDERY